MSEEIKVFFLGETKKMATEVTATTSSSSVDEKSENVQSEGKIESHNIFNTYNRYAKICSFIPHLLVSIEIS